MSQQNKQPIVPFEIGIKQVFDKWKQMGWVCVYEQNGYAIYNSKLQFMCNSKNIRALLVRYIADNVAIPVNENKFQAVVMQALDHLPLVNNVYGVYRPDIAQRLIPDDNGITYSVNTCDTYKPTTQPIAGESLLIQTWLDVMAGLFPDTHERKRVIQFIAHALQKPMEKPSFALLITGAQGNGKSSMLMEVLRIVLGKTYVTLFGGVSDLSKSTGAYRWANRLYCFVDDFADQNDKTSEKLKLTITQRTAAVKKLYCDEYTVPVITRFIFISNKHDPIRFYDGHDRRYYAPTYAPAQDVSAKVDNFVKQLRDDPQTRDALYRYLMDYPIDDFNPQVPEDTDNHKRMVGSSTSQVVQQFQAMLQIEPTDFVTMHWYEHMMFDHFGTRLTPTQLDNQWKQVVAHLRHTLGWTTSKRIRCSIGGKVRTLIGCASPNFHTRTWAAMVNALPEHKQARWLMSVAYFESINP
ncbi:TPA: ATP-binding protein [Escherichia coli]|nr:ATP-binding protein [Escherichia coli]